MFTFKPLDITDFKQLFIWLQEPHVKMYWDTEIEYTYEMIYDKYYPRIISGIPKMFIIKYESNIIGYIQSYIEDDLVKYNLTEAATGIDVYIGNINYLHKGYGSTIVSEFIEKVVFIDNSINIVIIDPEVENIIAQKAYYKAGFRHIKTMYSDIEKKDQYLMKLVRLPKKL